METVTACTDPILRILACVVGDDSLIYVSGPITSGKRRLDADQAGACAGLVPSNITELRRLVASLRQRSNSLVLDPSRLPFFENWVPEDYYQVWAEILRLFATTAVFEDNWEYSSGCSHEFLAATSFHIPTLDSSDRRITNKSAAKQLEAAILRLASAGLDTLGQQKALKYLRNRPARAGPSLDLHGAHRPRISPVPRNAKEEIGWLTAMLGTVVEPGAATYVSCPINGGLRKYEFLVSPEGARYSDRSETLRERVIHPNLRDQDDFVRRLRSTLKDTFIDPVKLPYLRQWAQDDFYSLWGEVIRRYAKRVVFANGWQFSDGCSIEFSAALENNKEALDSELHPLTASEGADLLRSSLATIRGMGCDAPRIRHALDRLSVLI